MKTNTLLMGPVATGKTYSLRTLLRRYPDENGRTRKGAGKTLLHVGLEPGFEESLTDIGCDMGYHIHYIPQLDVDWGDLEDMASRINANSDMTKITDPNKRNHTGFLDIYSTLQKFTCDRCGESFASADKLDDSYAICIDGLTGLSHAATHLTVGLKPHKSWPEYDAIQQLIENLLRKCVGSRGASFILVAHLDREPDPVAGWRLTMHTIGNKLAPRLTKDFFSEIVSTSRDSKGAFWWSTSEDNMDLKGRRLPLNDRIEPSFTQILGECE